MHPAATPTNLGDVTWRDAELSAADLGATLN
jgi:hypothetical protein